MAEFGIVLLVLAVIVPFMVALRIRVPGPLEEPPFKADASGITIFPACPHCGWRGELDATSYIDDPEAGPLTVVKSPPCRSCGRRWQINLTMLAQRRRMGEL